jgi:hypothetical protein
MFSCVQETKVITYKSLTMIKEKDGNHMEEIEEILCKDSRCGTYLFLTRRVIEIQRKERLKQCCGSGSVGSICF